MGGDTRDEAKVERAPERAGHGGRDAVRFLLVTARAFLRGLRAGLAGDA
jgi:hypothetical protein